MDSTRNFKCSVGPSGRALLCVRVAPELLEWLQRRMLERGAALSRAEALNFEVAELLREQMEREEA